MEPKIRERLNDLATEAPKGLEVPRTLVRRARRRMALTVAASACAVAIVAVGAFAGARALGNDTLQPATPTPSLGIFEQARGWIAIGGATITAVDPADPTRSVVLSASGGLPVAWSSDGTELLIARGEGLVVLRSDGSEVALPSHGTSGMAGGSFTPDGKDVVYGVNLSIYEVDAAGGTPRPIVTGEEASGTGYLLPFMTGGQLSPDGTTIAYVKVVDFHYRGLWLMNLDGTGQRELAGSSTIADLYGGADFQDIVPAAWSPDGTRLAFNGDGKTHCVLFVINADGTGLHRVTPQDACNLSPSWSPDGSRIAVTDEGSVLRTMNPDGTDVREFAIDTAGQPLFALWNPVL